ncbi:hypothetical protein PINS_up020296 [Pythium insidiosum]|nr:hypothetical protein PINS_up020296 [Pythium insidiosum]
MSRQQETGRNNAGKRAGDSERVPPTHASASSRVSTSTSLPHSPKHHQLSSAPSVLPSRDPSLTEQVDRNAFENKRWFSSSNATTLVQHIFPTKRMVVRSATSQTATATAASSTVVQHQLARVSAAAPTAGSVFIPLHWKLAVGGGQTRSSGTALFTGPISCFRYILAKDGVRGLYRGLPATLVGVLPEKAIKLA